jgi:hypothetical protein
LSWLEKWIGPAAFKLIPQRKTRHGSALMNSFETAKSYFNGDDDEVMVPIPGECGIKNDDDKQIEDGQLTITG